MAVEAPLCLAVPFSCSPLPPTCVAAWFRPFLCGCLVPSLFVCPMAEVPVASRQRAGNPTSSWILPPRVINGACAWPGLTVAPSAGRGFGVKVDLDCPAGTILPYLGVKKAAVPDGDYGIRLKDGSYVDANPQIFRQLGLPDHLSVAAMINQPSPGELQNAEFIECEPWELVDVPSYPGAPAFLTPVFIEVMSPLTAGQEILVRYGDGPERGYEVAEMEDKAPDWGKHLYEFRLHAAVPTPPLVSRTVTPRVWPSNAEMFHRLGLVEQACAADDHCGFHASSFWIKTFAGNPPHVPANSWYEDVAHVVDLRAQSLNWLNSPACTWAEKYAPEEWVSLLRKVSGFQPGYASYVPLPGLRPLGIEHNYDIVVFGQGAAPRILYADQSWVDVTVQQNYVQIVSIDHIPECPADLFEWLANGTKMPGTTTPPPNKAPNTAYIFYRGFHYNALIPTQPMNLVIQDMPESPLVRKINQRRYCIERAAHDEAVLHAQDKLPEQRQAAVRATDKAAKKLFRNGHNRYFPCFLCGKLVTSISILRAHWLHKDSPCSKVWERGDLSKRSARWVPAP